MRGICIPIHSQLHLTHSATPAILLTMLLKIFLFTLLSIAQSVFVIQDTTIGGKLAAKRIANTNTGEYVEVITDFGGLVEDLQLKSIFTGKMRQVLVTHNNDADEVLENTWWKGMLLIPWANRIAYGKYEFFDKTYQLPVNEHSTDPPLNNAIHGLMNGRKMSVLDTEVTSLYGKLDLGYHFDEPVPGYPFKLDVVISYQLSRFSSFGMTFYVTNTMDTTPLPFYMGWHPYFACTPYQAYLILDECTLWNRVELNNNMNPTGTTHLFTKFDGTEPIGGTASNPTFYDDEFKPRFATNPDCESFTTHLYDPPTDQFVMVYQDKSFPLVHVFTGYENAVAIKPMSGMADAYNNHDGLTILSGGETWSGYVGVAVI